MCQVNGLKQSEHQVRMESVTVPSMEISVTVWTVCLNVLCVSSLCLTD